MSDPGLPEALADIAIIGMSGRFPGANDLDAFWRNLRDGVESITFLSAEELAASSLSPAVWQAPNFVPAVSIVDDVDLFDAAFFGYTPREAEILDPQQRVFLECAWQALEHAGYDSESDKGLVGVYGGVGLNTYLLTNLYGDERIQESLGAGGILQVITGNDRDYLTTRISYKLNLKGPSVNVQTACSTSLVAVHLACQGLLNYQCDIALAGGVALRYLQSPGHSYVEGGIPSPDGHCRAFDTQAQGTIFGSGVGIVVLKRLADAMADGDTIHAVVKGSAVNNDGAVKVGYTAPSVEGQTAVIAMAHEMADIDPETISYVEAHGTGTPLGDPIEVAALTQVFRAKTWKKDFCAIGSVKTNIGHTGAAAGVAGLIKTVMALEHKQIPPSLHFHSPNPKIDFANSPFYVNAELSEWKSNGAPRRAGVSSFGIGGTNAHVIVEEAPPAAESGPSRPWQLLALSARTGSELESATDRLLAHLKQHPDLKLADVAYTLQVGRRSFSHRRMLVCQDRDDALAALEARDPKRVITQAREQRDRSVVFMFSGQGAQYVEMAQELYQQEPCFREHVDQCARLLRPALGLDLRQLIYPSGDWRLETGDWGAARQDQPPASSLQLPTLEQTWLAQPALFVVEYALAQLWLSWGVRPQAMIGHSIGEYVAACLAGVFSLEDALVLVVARGRLMQRMPAGAMLSVALPEQEVLALLDGQLSLAAVNGPARCVVAGPFDAVMALERVLAEQGVDHRRLHTSHAFHSAMMEPILAPFAEQVKQIALKAPAIPYISNVTGTWITPEEATDPHYWAQHLRQGVRFADGLSELLRDPKRILLEVGPGQTLAALARQHPGKPPAHVVLASLRHPQEQQSDVAFLLNTLGQLWLAGLRLDWSGLYARERRRRLPLPTYPFERQRYWIAPPKPTDTPSSRPGALRKRPDLADWFAIPSWKRSLPPVPTPRDPTTPAPCWLVLSDARGLGAQLVKRLEYEGANIVTVLIGDAFGIRAEGVYTLNPRRAEDYDALLEELRALDMLPQMIAHLWNVTPDDPPPGGERQGDQDLSFYSLLFLAQALGRHDVTGPLRIGIVSNNMQQVSSEPLRCPAKATLLGPCIVIPQEYPNIACQSIDIVLPDSGTLEEQELAEQLIAELSAPPADRIVAYRGCHRWVRTFEAARLDEAIGRRTRLREGGVYLITGGLGGIGLVLADHFARIARAKLVLIGRSAFPARAEWSQRLAAHGEHDRVDQTIRKLLMLEDLGAEVLVVAADVTDEAQMRAVVAQAQARFGAIHGVVHAAGIAGGGLIQLKEPELAGRVLAPKVQGVRTLEAALAGTKLDFMALCSSTIAITGGVGQVDYCAANAFLDAYAQANANRRGGFTISINWDAWQEVGMAANVAAAYGRREPPEEAVVAQVGHPLLDRRILATAQRAIYQTTFSPATHWVLAEHAIMGTPTLPGTTYLEMARAAFEHQTGARAAELREVFFLAPLMVGAGEQKEVQTILELDRDGAAFRVVSRSAAQPGAEPAWQEHARGRIGRLDAQPPKRYDVAAIIAACAERVITVALDDLERADRIVSWGPRWRSLKQVHLGAHEGIAVLELPDEFGADLDAFGLHPALLDVATAVLSGFAGGDGKYLPLSYERVAVRGPLSRQIYSYVRYKEDVAANKETLSCDIALLDEHGQELVAITEFTLKRVHALPARTAASERAMARPAEGADEAPPFSEPMLEASGAQARAGREPPAGILSGEGVEAFKRILAYGRLSQVVVSTRDINRMIARARTLAQPHLQSDDVAGEARAAHPRPELQSAYAAPRNEVERRLAESWQIVLGIEQVGIHDNYFELGGDSVQVIQIIARCGNAGLQITPAQLFQHQTIAELAAVLDAGGLSVAERGETSEPAPPVEEPREASEPAPATDGDYVAADFPEAGLDQEDLDRFLSSIQDQGE